MSAAPLRRRSPWRPLTVLAVIAALSCTSESPTDSFELAGFVTERGSDRGVRGARVVFSSDTRFTAETTTNGDGFYEMNVETDRPFGQVRASAAGFEENEQTVFFDTPTRRIDLSLRPAP